MINRPLAVLLLTLLPVWADDSQKAPATPDHKQRSISGTVTDAEGNSVVAEVWVHWYNAKAELLTTSKADGTFAATLPFGKGEYGNGGFLVVRAKGHGADFKHHGEKYDPETMQPKSTINFKLPKERKLTGRVVDTTGKPVVDAKVTTREVSSFDHDAEADKKLLSWAKDEYLGNSPHSPVRLSFNDGYNSKPSLHFLRSPFSATTNA